MVKHILTLIWNKKKSNFLLFLEIVLAFLILFAVIAFVTHNVRRYVEPLGFESENLWVAHLDLETDMDSLTAVNNKERLLQELSQMPDIKSVAYGCNKTPFRNSANITGHDDNGFYLLSWLYRADEKFDKTLGLKLIKGRWFDKSDSNAKYPPVVVSQKLLDEHFGEREVLDSIFTIEDDQNRIIGIVEHYKAFGGEFTDEKPLTFFYRPSNSIETPSLYIRTKEGANIGLEEKVNNHIATITKSNNFIIEHIEQSRVLKSQETWVPIIALLSICGFLIINVALGLFGVLWYNINKRRAEIGLRRTLGATKGNISFQFIVEILLVVFSGILVGIFFAIQLPLMDIFDIENSNYYYAILIAMVVILLIVLICAYYPSRQAALIHPAVALHEE